MEAVVESSTKVVDEKQKELKTFKKCFIVCLDNRYFFCYNTLQKDLILLLRIIRTDGPTHFIDMYFIYGWKCNSRSNN